jgi:hypothetical protein
MKGKDIVVITALAAGAYLLLGGSGALSGGVEGGNGKKATAITGITPPNDGGGGSTTPTTPTTPITPPPSYNTPIPNYGNITTPFEPSPYLLGLIAQKYAPASVASTNPPPITKKEVAYEAGTQAMFQGFNYPDMVKTSGGYGYTDQQIYTPVADMGKGILNERLNQVIVAPQSYVDSIPAAIPTKKDIVAVPYLSFNAIGGVGYNTNGGGFEPISTPAPTVTTTKKDTATNIVAVPYLSFGVGGIGLNTNSGFTPVSTPAPAPVATPTVKKTTTATTTTTSKTTINSTVKNIAPTYSNKKYGGWG